MGSIFGADMMQKKNYLLEVRYMYNARMMKGEEMKFEDKEDCVCVYG